MSAKLIAAATAVMAAATAGQAQAHAHLVAASPPANAAVAAPKQLELHFNERLMPRFSGLAVIGANGRPAAMRVGVGADGKTLVATAAAPLAPGVYRVDWHTVSADTHRVHGTYSFTVR